MSWLKPCGSPFLFPVPCLSKLPLNSDSSTAGLGPSQFSGGTYATFFQLELDLCVLKEKSQQKPFSSALRPQQLFRLTVNLWEGEVSGPCDRQGQCAQANYTKNSVSPEQGWPPSNSSTVHMSDLHPSLLSNT